MKSVNKVILAGGVTADPETSYTPSGTAMTKFRIATNESYKDRVGDWKEKTEYHYLVSWGKVAELIAQLVQKGTRLYIEGSLSTSSWEDKSSGEKKYRTDIVVRDFMVLSGGRSQESQGANKAEDEDQSTPF